MNNKKELRPYLISLTVGMILVGIGLTTNFDYYSKLILMAGFGLACGEAVHALRLLYWKSPKRHEEYEAKKEEARINSIDERKQFLRMKSGHITYQIMVFVLLFLALALALFRTDSWIIGMVFLLFVFQYVTGIIVFRILEKRL